MGDCVKDNDPLDLIWQKTLLGLTGGKLPKTFVAKLAKLAGDKKLAGKILASLKVPGASKVTLLPASLSAALKAPGKASQFLHGLGAGMGPFWLSYGLYMAQVNSACVGYCCGERNYDPSVGLALPFDVIKLSEQAVDLVLKIAYGHE